MLLPFAKLVVIFMISKLFGGNLSTYLSEIFMKLSFLHQLFRFPKFLSCFLSHSFAVHDLFAIFAAENQYIRMMTMTKNDALNALKKALRHKKEAKQQFEQWLQEKGIEGKVVTA